MFRNRLTKGDGNMDERQVLLTEIRIHFHEIGKFTSAYGKMPLNSEQEEFYSELQELQELQNDRSYQEALTKLNIEGLKEFHDMVRGLRSQLDGKRLTVESPSNRTIRNYAARKDTTPKKTPNYTKLSGEISQKEVEERYARWFLTVDSKYYQVAQDVKRYLENQATLGNRPSEEEITREANRALLGQGIYGLAGSVAVSVTQMPVTPNVVNNAGKVAGTADDAAEKAAANVRKFSEYIFKDGVAPGKDVVFKNLGYTVDDSQMLINLYQEQAAAKYASGKYTLGKLDKFGQRINIEIELRGIGDATGKTSYIQSGWMIQADGSIKLNTPFAGFTR